MSALPACEVQEPPMQLYLRLIYSMSTVYPLNGMGFHGSTSTGECTVDSCSVMLPYSWL